MFETLTGSLLATVFYWPGWLLLKALSFGRYPPKGAKHNVGFVITFGLAICIVAVGIIFS